MDDTAQDSSTIVFPKIFVKFGRRTHMESLRKGNLHMKKLGYFMQLEKESQKKGRGDEDEGVLTVSNANVKFIVHETGESITIPFAKTQFAPPLLGHPIFCLTHLKAHNFEVQNQIGDDIKARLVFTDEQKREILEEFGDTALVILAAEFVEKFQNKCSNEDLAVYFDTVTYDDFEVNNYVRMKNFFEYNPRLFFWKDKDLEYQQEFRVVVLNKTVEDFLELSIGDLSEISFLVPTEYLLSGGLEVKYSLEQAQPQE